MPTKVKEPIAMLEADGWVLVRTKGSRPDGTMQEDAARGVPC